MRLLLVEDEPEMAAALTSALQRHDAIVDHVPTLDIAKTAVRDGAHDVILLDRQLPDGDGIDLIRHLRAHNSQVPVIVITARGSLPERIGGLDHGADDYITKPFAIDELLARIRAVLRRPAERRPLHVRVGELAFDLDGREASVAGTVIDLPRRELLVLEALIRRHGRTVLRSAIEEAVYNYDDAIQSNSLDSHISRLRKKLSEAGAGVEIHGIRGVGYLLRPIA
ncbi:response regulator transcription factor [Tardiphaga sp.]|jgi:DNA-binding response OmpR family regulator|uniref:response regulator transcription factor n=1 Tax=Tardiphaga sp. TaxID=1926292 RepID=UPI0037D9D38B